MNNSKGKILNGNFGGNAILQLIANRKGGGNLTLIFECHKKWRGLMIADNDDAHFVSIGFITVYWLRQSFMAMMNELDCALEKIGLPKETKDGINIKRL